MIERNVAEAETELSPLLGRAHAGEEIIVRRAGVPRARIVPRGGSERRRPGAWRGLLSDETLDVLDAPLPDHAHRDPFDRLLAAQAATEKLAIISSDEIFDQLGGRRVW